MTDEREADALAGDIRRTVSELNNLLQSAARLGLRVDVDTNDLTILGYRERVTVVSAKVYQTL